MTTCTCNISLVYYLRIKSCRMNDSWKPIIDIPISWLKKINFLCQSVEKIHLTSIWLWIFFFFKTFLRSTFAGEMIAPFMKPYVYIFYFFPDTINFFWKIYQVKLRLIKYFIVVSIALWLYKKGVCQKTPSVGDQYCKTYKLFFH